MAKDWPAKSFTAEVMSPPGMALLITLKLTWTPCEPLVNRRARVVIGHVFDPQVSKSYLLVVSAAR
jgi:hypothetical protein